MPPLQTTVVQMLSKYLYSMAILIMSQQYVGKNVFVVPKPSLIKSSAILVRGSCHCML